MPINFGLRCFSKLLYRNIRYFDALLFQFHAAHLYEILRDFSYALFAFVDREVWPVDQLLVNLFGHEHRNIHIH